MAMPPPPTLTMMVLVLPMVTMALAMALTLTLTMATPILRVLVGAVMLSRTAASVRLGHFKLPHG